MFDPKNLQNLLYEQKQLLTRIEHESSALNNADTTKENERLKKELEQAKTTLAEKSAMLDTVTQQNRELQNVIFAQVHSRKTNILHRSQIERQIYFGEIVTDGIDRLTELENDLQLNAMRIRAMLEQYNYDARESIGKRLDELAAEAAAIVAKAKADVEEETAIRTEYSRQEYEKLRQEQIADEAIAKIGMKSNLEAFIGGNLINKVGISFVYQHFSKHFAISFNKIEEEIKT